MLLDLKVYRNRISLWLRSITLMSFSVFIVYGIRKPMSLSKILINPGFMSKIVFFYEMTHHFSSKYSNCLENGMTNDRKQYIEADDSSIKFSNFN